MGKMITIPAIPVMTCDGMPLEVESSENAATTPDIQRIDMGAAGNEESYTLPAGTNRFQIAMEKGILTLNINNTIGTKYVTVGAGGSYEERGISPTASLTLYFKSNKTDDIAEIISWS